MEFSKYGIIIIALAIWYLGEGFYGFMACIQYAFPSFIVFLRDILIPLALGAISIVSTTFLPTQFIIEVVLAACWAGWDVWKLILLFTNFDASSYALFINTVFAFLNIAVILIIALAHGMRGLGAQKGQEDTKSFEYDMLQWLAIVLGQFNGKAALFGYINGFIQFSNFTFYTVVCLIGGLGLLILLVGSVNKGWLLQGVGAIAYAFFIIWTMIKYEFTGPFLITWLQWIIGLAGCALNIFVGFQYKTNGGNAMGEYFLK